MLKSFLKRSLQRAAILTATAKMKNITRGLITCFLTLGLALSVPLALTLPGDVYAAPGGGGGAKEKGGNKCSDGIDNDNDGFIDCDDDGCFSQSYCQVTTTTGATTTTTFTSTTTTTTSATTTTTGGSTTTTTIDTGNTPPVANNDSYSTDKNTALNVSAPGVLGNDYDADGDPLTAVLENDVTSGTLTLNDNGSFDYTPIAGFTGDDTFTYFANDDLDLSDASATVTITVEDVAPPTGEELYLTNCRMCHGIEAVGGFAQRDVRNAGPSRIRGAITRRADMNFLGTRPNPLTDAEIESIAAYFDTLPRGDDDIPKNGDLVLGEEMYRKSCSYCHSFGGDPIEPPRPGPDLLGIGTTYSDAFLGAWVGFPTEMIEAGAYQHALDPYWMPDLGHSDINAWDI